MDQLHSITFTPNRERGQHLKFEERCTIKALRKLGYSLRAIAKAVNCSPSTVLYELKRGTGQRAGSRGRFPEYSAKRGQCSYQINRSRCHRKAVALNGNPFVDWLTQKVLKDRWSIDACVGYARKNRLFPAELIVCTKTIYHAVWSGQIRLRPLDLPEALKRSPKHNRVRCSKKVLGRSIEERPADVSERITEGHWEIDTVVGHRAGKESVVLTLTEKKTDFYIAMKIPGKDPVSVMDAMDTLRNEYGERYFSSVFQTITADNGSEFSTLSGLETYGVSIYYAHPYSSWERPQNERHNRIFRRYLPKHTSVERYSSEQILSFADEMNALPRRCLNYQTPEVLFDAFLDRVYTAVKDHTA